MKQKKILAQFLCNIIRYMLLMFDLWHSQGGIAEGIGGGRCGESEIDVVKCHTVPHRHDKALWVNDSIHKVIWFVLVLFGRYNQMTYF